MPALLPRRKIRIFEETGSFPMEGAILDLWKLDKSRLRHDKVADSDGCDKLFQGHLPGAGHESSVEHGNSIFVGWVRGMDITVADVFESAEPETSSATVIVASDGGMIRPRTAALALKVPKSELVRLSKAKTMSKINCMSKAFGEYAQQAGPARPVTSEGATVEVVCDADL
jgi:hypothetical protein